MTIDIPFQDDKGKALSLQDQVEALYKKVEAEAERRLIDAHCFLPTKKGNGTRHPCPHTEECHQDGVCRKFSAREWDSMVAEEMLLILDQVEGVTLALRGKVVEIIERNKLYAVNYESLGQMLEARGVQLSSSEASDYARLSNIIFPYLEEQGLPTQEVWQRVGKSKLRLITGPIAEVIESDKPEEEKAEEVADLLKTAEISSWRELWRQTSEARIPPIEFSFKRRKSGAIVVSALVTEQQLELLRRRFARHAEFEEEL
jgi:hypothetical protein